MPFRLWGKLCGKDFDRMNCWISDGKSKSEAMNFELTVIVFEILRKLLNEVSAPTRFLTVIASPVREEVEVVESRALMTVSLRKKLIASEVAEKMIDLAEIGIAVIGSNQETEWIVGGNREGMPMFNGIGEIEEEIQVVVVKVGAMIER